MQTGLELGGIDIHTLAGTLPVQQRPNKKAYIIGRCNEVGINTEFRRGSVQPTCDMAEAGESRKLESPAGMPGKRPGLTLHTRTQHNYARVQFLDFFISQAQFFDHPAGEVFYHDVSPGRYL